MNFRAAATRWSGDHGPLGGDAALALVVVALTQVDIWANPAVREHPVVVPFYAAGAASLALRRRYPLSVAALATTLANLPYFFGVPRSQPFSPLVVFGIAAYTVAAHLDLRRAATGLAEVLGLCWVPILVLSEERVADVVFAALLIGTVWVGGRVLRQRLLRAVQLERRALQAEHEREQAEREAIARERGRIARELHDIVSHGVSLMIVLAGGAEETLARDPERARQPLRAIQETGRDALADMKRLLGVLRVEEAEVGLGPQPSLANLERLIAQVRETGLAVELAVEGEAQNVQPGVDLCAYRVLQEALTNSIKHGRPSSARVVLQWTGDHVVLDVTDDGPSGVANGQGGHGLVGMRERVRLYGGELEAGPLAEGGFRVHARLPLHSP